jgi:hypothetical protein
MTFKHFAGGIGIFLFLIGSVFGVSQQTYGHAGESSSCPSKEPLCGLIDEDESAATALDEATMPQITDPGWTRPKASSNSRVVTYQVQTKGVVGSNLESFATQAAETYADSRGWKQLGVTFQRVQSGGQFTLILTQAVLMTTFSATGCDTTYSCNVGNYVVINNDRWQSATPSWNAGGGSLRNYRHMVVNHETGHWLGHGHQLCGGAGQSAPVMQQQSIDLQGCTFNPWPLKNELYSPRLGL